MKTAFSFTLKSFFLSCYCSQEQAVEHLVESPGCYLDLHLESTNLYLGPRPGHPRALQISLQLKRIFFIPAHLSFFLLSSSPFILLISFLVMASFRIFPLS